MYHKVTYYWGIFRGGIQPDITAEDCFLSLCRAAINTHQWNFTSRDFVACGFRCSVWSFSLCPPSSTNKPCSRDVCFCCPAPFVPMCACTVAWRGEKLCFWTAVAEMFQSLSLSSWMKLRLSKARSWMESWATPSMSTEETERALDWYIHIWTRGM